MRAFLYARVSTLDKEQSPEPQLAEMREYCQRRGWEWEEFADRASATKKRPEYERMVQLIRRQKCDVLLCRHFDRVGRSTIGLISLLEELKKRGIAFVSLNQQIDTSTAMGTFFFQIFAAFAEFERAMISERVQLGMAHAKSKGVKLGRRRVNPDIEKIRLMRAQGASLRVIARAVGVSDGSVRNLLKASARPRKKGVKIQTRK